MTIHKEGYVTLLIWIVVSVALVIGAKNTWPQLTLGVVIFCNIIFLVFLQFFRAPIFTVEKNPNFVIAPADGKVVAIEEVEEPEYLKKRCRQISIFMSPINVHVNRMPVSGTISYFKYHPGKYLVAWHPKSSTLNERTTVAVKMENGEEVLFRQIAGFLARRICWYVKEGEPKEQGEEFGFIKFGSRVDIFLPLDAKVNVKIGDKTTGGRTVIAQWK